MIQGLKRFLVGLAILPLSAIPLLAQDVSGIPLPASPPAVVAPEYEVEATSRVLEKTVTELDRFTYEVELSWEGAQQWLSLDSPAVEWPDGIRQIEASQKSGSSMGDSGPLGTKSFLYLLEAQKSGETRLPPIAVQLLAPGAEDPITVEAPGITVTILERTPAASEKLSAFLSQYRFLVLGVAVLIAVAIVLLVLKNRKEKAIQVPESDPWALIEEHLKKAESLRGAGRDREYYESLEKTVREGLVMATAVPNPADPDMIPGFPTTVAEDLKSLLNECSERKYRPDRPRPEEMDRSLRQARTVLKTLKELHQKRGKEV